MLSSFCSRVEPLGFNPNPLILDKEPPPSSAGRIFQMQDAVVTSCDVRAGGASTARDDRACSKHTHDRQLICSEQRAGTGLQRHYLVFLPSNDSFNIIFTID